MVEFQAPQELLAREGFLRRGTVASIDTPQGVILYN